MSETSMSQLVEAISGLRADLNTKEQLDTERRKTDDARFTAVTKGHESIAKSVENLAERTDKHGLRTTAIETKWEAFFGDQGAFRLVLKGVDEQGKKIDKQGWFIAIGIGVLAALQFIIPFVVKK